MSNTKKITLYKHLRRRKITMHIKISKRKKKRIKSKKEIKNIKSTEKHKRHKIVKQANKKKQKWQLYTQWFSSSLTFYAHSSYCCSCSLIWRLDTLSFICFLFFLCILRLYKKHLSKSCLFNVCMFFIIFILFCAFYFFFMLVKLPWGFSVFMFLFFFVLVKWP